MIFHTATIIISIYKNIEALKCVLDSLQKQTYQNFDVIVSEDAEHQEVKTFIENYSYSGNLIHLTHPDNGWQKNIALNKAIKAAKSEYLIFIDGDCILHPSFVEQHLKNAAPDSVIAGKRIKLDQWTSDQLLNSKITPDQMNRYILFNFRKLKARGAQFIEEGIYINPNGIFGFIPKIRSMRNLKGCNMSFPKKAILDINGFDEDYIRPAIGEDIDLTWRFVKVKYKIISIRNLAVQYHLWHKENWTDQSENIRLMHKKQSRNEFVCKNGLQKL